MGNAAVSKRLAGLPGFTGCELTPVGVTFITAPTQVELERMLATISALSIGREWYLGDFLLKWEQMFQNVPYRQVALWCGEGEKRLRLWMFAASRYSLRERVEGLTMAHHLYVAFVTDKDKRRELLEKALANGWNANELRRRARLKAPNNASVSMGIRVSVGVWKDVVKLAELEEMGTSTWINALITDQVAKRMITFEADRREARLRKKNRIR